MTRLVTNGSADGCDEGRAAINGNEAWVRLAYDTQGTPSNAGALMGMELAHTMGAVPAGRNDGAFHSLYTNSDYLVGDLNRAFNTATRSVLAGTSDDHTVMRLVAPVEQHEHSAREGGLGSAPVPTRRTADV